MSNTKELWDSYKNKGWSSLSSSPWYLPYPGSSCMQVIACSACFNRLLHKQHPHFLE
jgi:hypothetical protein